MQMEDAEKAETLGQEESQEAVGIDLGTMNGRVAFYEKGRITLIGGDVDDHLTPMFAAFTVTGRLIGDAAKNQVAMNPSNTVFDAKRLIGRKFDDPAVQADMKHRPFKVIQGEAARPKIQAKEMGKIKTFYPEEISAMVLTEMKGTAEASFDQHEKVKVKIKNAVITVPAYFNDSQRLATKYAGTICGLNVLRIINEPTAAAIAFMQKYYAEKDFEKGEKNVLIFDLGSHTFDVSILTIKKGTIGSYNAAVHQQFGGEDFDNRLVNHFESLFKNKPRTYSNPSDCWRLRAACERAKRTLSSSTKAILVFDFLRDVNGKQITDTVSLSRARFEELCAKEFKMIIGPVETAINNAKMDKSQIHDIVLVGGSIRIPKVQMLLSECFPRKKITILAEAVAYGAAVQAAILSGKKSETINSIHSPYGDKSENVRDLQFLGVAPPSIGIGTSASSSTALNAEILSGDKSENVQDEDEDEDEDNIVVPLPLSLVPIRRVFLRSLKFVNISVNCFISFTKYRVCLFCRTIYNRKDIYERHLNTDDHKKRAL